jgi:hypothetical protein
MVYIYVLKLQQNKYYVGKTNNPLLRLENHFNTQGSEWTKLYKPISIEALIPDCDDYDEDKYTRMYMDKYGIDNVRGGSYTQVVLDKTAKEHLSRMSNGTNNRCFTCGKSGHFAKDCHENDKELQVPFENLLKSQPIMIREDYKKYIELLNTLQSYKIKVGDIVLNTKDKYHTLKELLDDTDNVLNNFDETEFSTRRGMNIDLAKNVKSYVPKMKIEIYNDLSKILASFNQHLYNELQQNKSIPYIIKECYEMFGYKYINV